MCCNQSACASGLFIACCRHVLSSGDNIQWERRKKQQQQFNSLDPTQHDLPAALLCPLFTMVVCRRSGKPIGAPPRVFCQRKTMWPRGSHPGDHQLVFFRAGVPGSILAWRCSLSLCLAEKNTARVPGSILAQCCSLSSCLAEKSELKEKRSKETARTLSIFEQSE